MSSYLSKSKKDFKPKAPVRRVPATASVSSQTSVRGSVERQTQTPQPAPAPTPSIDVQRASPLPSPIHVQAQTGTQAARGQPVKTTSAQATTQHDHLAVPQHSPRGRRSDRNNSSVPPVVAEPLPVVNDAAQSSQHTLNDRGISTEAQSQATSATAGTSSEPAEANPQAEALKPRSGTGQNETSKGSSANVKAASATKRDTGKKRSRAGAAQTSTPAATQQSTGATAQVPNHSGDHAEQEEDSQGTSRSRPKQRARKQARARSDAAIGATSRARTAAEGADGEDNEGESVARPKQKRRRREATPEDAEDAEIAPATVMMTDLTKESNAGKKSTRESRLQERDKEEAARKQERIREEAQAFMDNPDGNLPLLATDDTAPTAAPTRPPPPEPPTTRVAPRVRLVNGQIVQDEESRMVDRHFNAEAEREDEEVHIEDELTRRMNSSTFMKRERRTKWTADQTELFFDSLRMFGTDFLTISKMFPGRTRRQIKLKFNKEEREDREFIKQVLVHERKTPNLDDFKRISGAVFKDPAEIEREMAEDKEAIEEEQRRLDEAIEENARQREEEIAAENDATRESAKENEMESDDDDYVRAPSKLKKKAPEKGRAKLRPLAEKPSRKT